MGDHMCQENMTDNIWDRIFKTLFLYMPEMFLPLVNEVFHENYDRTARLIPLNGEFYNKDNSKVVSDTAFLVNGRAYHFECQFSNDKEMAFRMFEYDFHIGLSDSKSKKRIDEFDFPRSCVVYITTNKKVPEKLKLKVNFPNGSHTYEVETIRVHDYGLESIQKKKLLVFLPYFALRYPQKLKSKKPPTKEEIANFYKDILVLLEDAYNNGIIDITGYDILLETIREAEQRVFHDYEEIKEEVDGMVSNVLDLKCIRIRDEAVKETAQKTAMGIIEKMRQCGIYFSEEQMQELSKIAMEEAKVQGELDEY